MLLRFSLLFLFCISGISNAPNPNCSSNSFCYNPTDSQKITLTKVGENLKLKLFDEKSEIQKIQLIQKNGKSVEIGCSAESGNSKNEGNGAKSCEVDLKADQFEKNLPLSIHLSDSQFSDSFSLDSLVPPLQQGLTKDQRRSFSKAHAILMIFGWLLFVPTGFLFARIGKDLFKDELWFGTAVWFQVHRAANFMGVVCICTSMLCIFISQQWTWKGTGSKSKYWTEVHTDLGVISSVLAVAQPINSLFRCGPTHSRRIIFNWAHRITGIVAYTLALTAIIIAAVQFKRIWNEPLLELVLVCLPIVICLVVTIVFTLLESDRFRDKAAFGDSMEDALITVTDEDSKPIRKPHILKLPAVFWAVGVFFCIAVALSLLVVNGYKN
ncbi:Protein CBG13459 [Caenorhabditis briggsae]|uniref:ascorbate ferrireductase (transmembrane) n=1 Tax=Caenorhabditis briggsae TaxID=6238 RepID=A8XHQ0_CAEBR|nr:Protein CBG13459 [Caenorhabditis briggsae]CAP32167.1 Protein CBG13459 [Caenorhabditis briggsae]